MNAPHRWNLLGLIVLLTAIAVDQPVVAKIFRFRRVRRAVVEHTSAITPIVDLDATACKAEACNEELCNAIACNDEALLPCEIVETHDTDLCLAVHFVSTETIVPEIMLGDLDEDGVISPSEASSVLNNGAVKERLFAMPLPDQKDYLMCFDAEIRTQIDRLAATHGTWKWRFAVRAAAKMGLTATEAEAIAVAWSN